jgi:hypothetical protein
MVRHRRQVNCGPIAGRCNRACRSLAVGRMVVNQSLQRGKKLPVGGFIGSRLSFGFRLRSRCAGVSPGLGIDQGAALVAKLGPQHAARVPGAFDSVQLVVHIRCLELALKLPARARHGVPKRNGAGFLIVLEGNDRDARTRCVPEDEGARLFAVRKSADDAKIPILRAQFVRAIGNAVSARSDDVEGLPIARCRR